LTAVELLVATALASMLMVAVLGILGLLAAKRKVLVDEAPVALWQRGLVEQLRRDLSNARRFELAPDRLRLLGYGSRGSNTRQPTHRPAEVVYRVTRASGRSWLIREEIQLDLMSNANRQTEIVCGGLSTIAMEIPGRPEHGPRRSGAVPECCRITIAGDVASQPVVEVLFCR
jgi:hypothetical protein